MAKAQVLASAALRLDRATVADASAVLARMSADPVLDLGRTSEAYAALRRAIVAWQTGRPAIAPVRSA